MTLLRSLTEPIVLLAAMLVILVVYWADGDGMQPSASSVSSDQARACPDLPRQHTPIRRSGFLLSLRRAVSPLAPETDDSVAALPRGFDYLAVRAVSVGGF